MKIREKKIVNKIYVKSSSTNESHCFTECSVLIKFVPNVVEKLHYKYQCQSSNKIMMMCHARNLQIL